MLLPSGAAAAPSTPATPNTPAAVQQQLGKLALQNDLLVERFDQAQTAVTAKQKDAAAARQQAQVAQAAFDQARSAMGATAAAQYEGGSLSATGALLSSQSGQSYLDRLTTLGVISSHTAQVANQMAAAHDTAATASRRADALLASATALRDQLGAQRASLQKEIDKYLGLLSSLNAAQRAAFLQQNSPTTSIQVDTSQLSGAAAKAVRFALNQVGKPYVYGASGPDSYDCSGLTMAAWGSAGVSLPHSAADQYNYGRHVSFNELRPGDLMFYDSPIGHVTIYAGSGTMVSAPQTGENVKVMPADAMMSSFVGATRLVG